MSKRKFLDGYDLKLKFGLTISNGSDQLLKLPTSKPPQIKNNFIDRNGLDQDLTNRVFEAREFVFNCVCEGATIAEFEANYFGLFALLARDGAHEYFDEFLNIPPIYIFYEEQTDIGQLKRTASDGYGMDFKLKFGENSPFDNIPAVILVDESNSVLVP